MNEKTNKSMVVVEWKRSIVRHLCNIKMKTDPRPFIEPNNDYSTHKEGCDYEYHK